MRERYRKQSSYSQNAGMLLKRKGVMIADLRLPEERKAKIEIRNSGNSKMEIRNPWRVASPN
jgi:hypothetical protein